MEVVFYLSSFLVDDLLESLKQIFCPAHKDEELFKKEIINQTKQLLRSSHHRTAELPALGAGLGTAGDLLFLAAQFNLAALLDRLLDPHAYPHLLLHINAKSESLLHIAAKVGHMDVVEALLHNARHAGEGLAMMLIEMRSRGGNTALHEAVRAKMLPVAKTLVAGEGMLMIRAANDEGKSPLYLAVEMGFRECVTMILEIDPAGSEQCGPGGRSLLHAAIISKNIGIAKTLLDKTPSLATQNDNKGQNPLHYATLNGTLKQVKLLLKMDWSAAYAMDNKGRSPLHLAAIRGYKDMVQEIYMKCPDSAHFLDGGGRNILHLTVENGRLGVAAYIMKQAKLSFLLNERDDFGDSPLHLAVKKIHTPFIYLFCRHPQLDKGIMNNKGQTALDIAESIGNRISIICLEDNGVPNGWYEEDDGQNANSSNFAQNPVRDRNDSEKAIKSLKSRANTVSLLAILIATVTFAAAFTMPGGYNSKGQPVLATQRTFKVFVIADTIAMTISVFVTVFQIGASETDHRLLLFTVRYCQRLIMVAILAMNVAFMAGVYAMVAGTSKWLPIFICALPLTVLYILLSPLTFSDLWSMKSRNRVVISKIFSFPSQIRSHIGPAI